MSHRSDYRQEPDTSQPSRILIPREHGAYVELLFSLATALALGGFKLAQLLLAVAAIAVFLAHEPILVLAGGRGTRSLGRLKSRAVRLAAALGVVAFTMGAMGLWNSPPGARSAILLPLVPAALLIPLIFRQREKTLARRFHVRDRFDPGRNGRRRGPSARCDRRRDLGRRFFSGDRDRTRREGKSSG
jgi:hypothetical protein